MRALATRQTKASPVISSDADDYFHIGEAGADHASRAKSSELAGLASASVPIDQPEQTIKVAVVKALTILGRQKDETNIVPYDQNYAKVLGPDKFDVSRWRKEPSVHAKDSWGTDIPGYPSYVLKYHEGPSRGHVIAMIPPTMSIEHWLEAGPSRLNFPVNQGPAHAFLNARPRN